MTSQYLLYCVLRKTLCTTSSVSERGDMDSENHSVVIRSIGSHSVKSTVLRPITWDGYIINAIYNTCLSIVKYKMSLWLMSSWDPFNRHIYYYNNNLIGSAGSRLVDRDWSPNQTRRGALSLINTQVPSSDVIMSLCGYSSVSEAWKVFVYVNGGASAIYRKV